ncbi:23S rRNA (adenine(2058)-N(6))-methyltransferase Erm(O) [Microtetraspora sp. NBRC 13810]|uniref:ErmE/ErmH/ErmO/ErmR family 23S rRNA (adenine(2058)-N(6))-methyltransferase n=1 Tax=Microtetraspora sp. NBRC 13810 TaxID=3030990 RepID=UPI0024A18F5D|nr:ErmE/ErmH/ErmO/ErmR family 23S rRNA (adenine(2058)-N(6))-methyltransferase [Microtetraspora sp. NBRC 13810]GLW07130.1 23S rRNA (adenine(2058)-N(6))-methyltransferase Erm(O) [Microtetraspora sp. NBRC 13810]
MTRSFAHGDHSHTQKQVRNGGGHTRPGRDRRREFSQNFLTDAAEIGRIVRAARPARDGLILEPGAGEGHLTRALADHCRKVIAYEIDPLLAGRLAARTRDDDRIEVARGDFTTARAPGRPFAVVGNIPYSVTAGIVRWCLRAPDLTSATLVTQWEYARKRTGDYGRWSRLTVTTWPRYAWELHGRIDRERFRPVPQTDSAIMRIERRPAGLLPAGTLADYAEFVELGFGGHGGTLYASLSRRHPPGVVGDAFARAGVDPAAVVAYVHPDQWLTLFRHVVLG